MGRIKPQDLLIQSKKKKAPSRISIATIVACIFFVLFIVISFYATYKHWFQSTEKYQFVVESKKVEVLKHAELYEEASNLISPTSAEIEEVDEHFNRKMRFGAKH